MMHIHSIAGLVNATVLSKGENHPIQTLNYDSRKSAGATSELFIALTGAHRDGHTYIEALYQLGVRNFLVSRRITSLAEANILQVDDTLAALQQIASKHREQYDLPVVGITGSNGKTIVKEWLATLLEHQWRVIKSPKSFNSQLGVPLSVWPLDQTHEVGVFEAGISQKGEMEKLASVIRPTVGIFTNIGEAHNQGFGSLAEKAREKALLFADAAIVICQKEHAVVLEALKQLSTTFLITWSTEDPSCKLYFDVEDHDFRVAYEGHLHHFKIKLQGLHELENLLHAISAAIVLGETTENIQRGIDRIKPVPMRLELKRGIRDTYILDDSYNNDLAGLSTALDYLLQQPEKTGKTVILSDILQSGKSPEILYSEVHDLLKKHQVSRLVGIGPYITQYGNLFSMEMERFASVNEFLRNAPDFVDETILVKGARDFGLERVVTFLEEKNHGTVLEVNYESILHNLNTYRKALNPETRLMVMVKAFAYGVGVEEIAHLLQYHQVDYLGVAYLDEAIHLRKKGINLPVMIMNVDWNSFALLETFRLEPEIYSLPMLRRFIEVCDAPPPVHLKIETGMHRLGFDPSDVPELIEILLAIPHLKVAGVFTHFSSAEDPDEDEYTLRQAAIFEDVYEQLHQALGYRPIKHALNSAGIIRWPKFHYDLVRLGIGLYGFDSSGLVTGLRPISTLKSTISQVKKVSKGDTIGYSRKGIAQADGQVATIAIGYADGYSRAFGNGNAYVLVNGQPAKTIGNVCMDMAMIDVSGLEVQAGDEVIVFGENPTIIQLAEWAGTIPYEILTNVSQRVKRVFVSE